jgi:hypothetical protein
MVKQTIKVPIATAKPAAAANRGPTICFRFIRMLEFIVQKYNEARAAQGIHDCCQNNPFGWPVLPSRILGF